MNWTLFESTRTCSTPTHAHAPSPSHTLTHTTQELGTYEIKVRLPTGDELPLKLYVVKR